MQIKHSSETHVVFPDGSRFLRSEKQNGAIVWESSQLDIIYRLKDGCWSAWDELEQSYVPLKIEEPTYEKDYQDYLLAQNYPFEKRVREAMENNTTAQEVIFKLARDYDFVAAIKNYLKKLSR